MCGSDIRYIHSEWNQPDFENAKIYNKQQQKKYMRKQTNFVWEWWYTDISNKTLENTSGKWIQY